MTTEQTFTAPERHKYKYYRRTTASDAVYGLGLIGAWVYFIGTATSFGMGVLGFLKGIVWPALLVYELLKYLNM
jgi:hypothetical protein